MWTWMASSIKFIELDSTRLDMSRLASTTRLWEKLRWQHWILYCTKWSLCRTMHLISGQIFVQNSPKNIFFEPGQHLWIFFWQIEKWWLILHYCWWAFNSVTIVEYLINDWWILVVVLYYLLPFQLCIQISIGPLWPLLHQIHTYPKVDKCAMSVEQRSDRISWCCQQLI